MPFRPRHWRFPGHDEDFRDRESFGDFHDDRPPIALAYAPPTGGFAGNGLPILSWNQAAAQITRDGASWSATHDTAVTVTYAFRATPPQQPLTGVSGFQVFNATQIAVAEEALRLWSEVANINFVRVGAGTGGPSAYSNNASILFGNFVTGGAAFSAFTFLPSPTATAPADFEGDIWVNISRDYDADPASFPRGALILAHEIGHALGLGHPADYGGGAGSGVSYDADAQHWQDTVMFTNMSYFSETNTGAAWGTLPLAPQLHDIASAQLLYGVNTTTRTGDTTYGFNSNAGHAVFSINSASQIVVFTIWDAWGTDTLDLSGYLTATELDLREEAFSSAGPATGGNARHNIAIARGAVVENGATGVGDDVLFGNAANNRLSSGAGSDTLTGDFGDDTLIGGAGADALDGGFGSDLADYSSSASAVAVNLATGAAFGGDAQGDALASIEYLRGSALSDALTGDANNNWLFGGAGNDALTGGDGGDLLQGDDGDDALDGGSGADTLSGGAGDDSLAGGDGADALSGGAGTDTADFSASVAGVTISLNAATGSGSGGDAQGDTLVSVENIIGSAFNDTLIGRDFFANTLSGGDGNDTLSGGTGGADVMNGGAGIDTLDYSLSPNGVDVRLFSGAASGGAANGDTYSSIENIIGSATKTDTLAGDANANSIWGGGGNETIAGREGSDTLFGEAGNDTLLGGADSDTLIGGIGADTLGGGAQDDLVDYSASDVGVTVNLQTGLGSGGHAQGDVFVSIEDVTGSEFDDTIVGKNNAWDNVFDGRGGNDTYTGGLGNDVFVFRANSGADTVTDFSALALSNNDTVQLIGFGANFDTFAEVIAAASQIGAHTMIDLGAGQTLTLQNTVLASLASGDFLFG